MPQFTEQDLELRARSVLTEQALALKEDRRRTYSLESTGTMHFGARCKGTQKVHTQLVYKNGEAIVVDPTVVQVEQEILARHQQVLAKKKTRWDKKEAEFKAEIAKLRETEAQLRAVIENLNKKKRAVVSSGGRSKNKQKLEMNDAARGQVEAVCKSQLWRVSKFIGEDDQVAFACAIVMSHTDDFRPKIAQPDGTPVDKSLKASAVVDFAKIYGSFIVSTINGYHSTTQSQVKTVMKQWFMTMEPEDYPTPERYPKAVLRIGLTFDKDKPELNAFERSILLWHAAIACPKCAGSNYWTRPQRCDALCLGLAQKTNMLRPM